MKWIQEYNEAVWTACKEAGTTIAKIRLGLTDSKVRELMDKAVIRYGMDVAAPLARLLTIPAQPYRDENISYEIWRHIPYDIRYTTSDIQHIDQQYVDSFMSEDDSAYNVIIDPKFLAWLKVEAALNESHARRIIDAITRS